MGNHLRFVIPNSSTIIKDLLLIVGNVQQFSPTFFLFFIRYTDLVKYNSLKLNGKECKCIPYTAESKTKEYSSSSTSTLMTMVT